VVPQLHEAAEVIGHLLVRATEFDFTEAHITRLGFGAYPHGTPREVHRSAEADCVVLGINKTAASECGFVAVNEVMPASIDSLAIRRLDGREGVLVVLYDRFLQIRKIDQRN